MRVEIKHHSILLKIAGLLANLMANSELTSDESSLLCKGMNHDALSPDKIPVPDPITIVEGACRKMDNKPTVDQVRAAAVRTIRSSHP